MGDFGEDFDVAGFSADSGPVLSQGAHAARIVHGLSVAEYHADRIGDVPTLSATIGKLLVEKTPAHAAAAHPRLSENGAEDEEEEEDGPPTKDTRAKLRGTLMHRLLLGAGADIVEIDAPDYRKKEAKELRNAAKNRGKVPILQHKLAPIRKGVEVIRARLEDEGIVLNGASEVVITWSEVATDGTPVWCRAMIDHLWQDPPCALDLKTLEIASEKGCAQHVAAYGHDIQNAAYRSGLAHLFPDVQPKLLFAFAEASPPHAVTLGELDGISTDIGDRKWRYAVDLWAKCLNEKRWPARYVAGRARFALPQWKVKEWLERMGLES